MKAKLCLITLCLILVSSCGYFAQIGKGYPNLLSEGRKITSDYTTFVIEPRVFKDREMLSVGLDLEGKTICYDRKSKSRLCPVKLKEQRPECIVPDELKVLPGNKLTDKEVKELNVKSIEWGKTHCEPQQNAWDNEVEQQPLIDFEVAAVDANDNEIPFVLAGQGEGYCRTESDQVCSQFSLDAEKSPVKSLDGVTLKAVKIKSVEGELKISNIYVVGAYRRD